VCDAEIAPGDFDLSTSGWFYGIWISLFLILVILILLIVAKKYTDKNWQEKGTNDTLSVTAVLLIYISVIGL